MSFDDKFLVGIMTLLFGFMMWLLYHLVVGYKHYKSVILKEKDNENLKKDN